MLHAKKLDAVYALRKIYGLKPLVAEATPYTLPTMPVLDAHSKLIFGNVFRDESGEEYIPLKLETLNLQRDISTVFFVGGIRYDATRPLHPYAHDAWGYMDIDHLLACLRRTPPRIIATDCRKGFPLLTNVDAPCLAEPGFQLYQGHTATVALKDIDVEETVMYRLSWLIELANSKQGVVDSRLRPEIDLISQTHVEFDAYSYFLLQQCLSQYEALASRRFQERVARATSPSNRRDIQLDFYGHDTESDPNVKPRHGKSEHERALELVNMLEKRLLKRRIMSTHYTHTNTLFSHLLQRDPGTSLYCAEHAQKCAKHLIYTLHTNDAAYTKQLMAFRPDIRDPRREYYAVPHTYIKMKRSAATYPIIAQSFALCTERDLPTLICDVFNEEHNAYASPEMNKQADEAVAEHLSRFTDAFCDAIRDLFKKYPDPARLTDAEDVPVKVRKRVAAPQDKQDHKSVAVLLALKAPPCIQRLHVQRHIAYKDRMIYMLTLRTLGVTSAQITQIWHPRLLKYYTKTGGGKPENEAKEVLDDIDRNYKEKKKTPRIPKSCVSIFDEGDCPYSSTCKSAKESTVKCTATLPKTVNRFPIVNPVVYTQRCLNAAK